MKKNVLKHFAKFTGKHLCQSLFFNKVAEIFKNIFFTENLWMNASEKYYFRTYNFLYGFDFKKNQAERDVTTLKEK